MQKYEKLEKIGEGANFSCAFSQQNAIFVTSSLFSV